MFLHNLKYELRSALRVKDLIFWLILFPMFLGIAFKIAFKNIYTNVAKTAVIPVAVVETQDDPVLHQVLEAVSNGDDALLSVQYVDADEADRLLEAEEVKGILNADGRLSLTVLQSESSIYEADVEETLLRNFAEQYNMTNDVARECIASDPASAQAVIESLTAEIKPVTEVPLTKGNPDFMIEYFTNLLAMVAMYGSITGLHITIQNQGNLSKLGARKCCSPTPKSVSLAACLLGSMIVQTICMVISVTFLRFVLRIQFGGNLGLIYLTSVLGGILGLSFGFCIGSIGRFQTGTKTSICFGVSMLCCFLSGLMIGNMKGIIRKHVPWVNKINPAAVITDSLYYLNIDSDYRRYIVTVITMAVLSAVLILLGFLMTRRKKYASV